MGTALPKSAGAKRGSRVSPALPAEGVGAKSGRRRQPQPQVGRIAYDFLKAAIGHRVLNGAIWHRKYIGVAYGIRAAIGPRKLDSANGHYTLKLNTSGANCHRKNVVAARPSATHNSRPLPGPTASATNGGYAASPTHTYVGLLLISSRRRSIISSSTSPSASPSHARFQSLLSPLSLR